jgi:hypothetical protein
MSDDARHLRELMDERDKRYQQRFESSEVALNHARESINRRLDLLNELRDGVATEAELQALQTVVHDLKDRMNLRDGKSSGFSASWAILLGAAMLAIAVYSAWGR